MGQHSAGFVWEQACSFLPISFVVLPGTLAETTGDSALAHCRLSGLALMTPSSEVKVCKASWNLCSEMSCGISTTVLTVASQVWRPDPFQEVRGTLLSPYLPAAEKSCSHTARIERGQHLKPLLQILPQLLLSLLFSQTLMFTLVDSVSSCRTFFLSVKQVKYF